MTKEQAKETLRNIARYHFIAYTDHTRERMLQRGVTPEDIKYVLEWGKISKLRKDKKHSNWKCQVQGKELDDEMLVIQAAIDNETKCIIITVY